jgi:hypothetical protein
MKVSSLLLLSVSICALASYIESMSTPSRFCRRILSQSFVSCALLVGDIIYNDKVSAATVEVTKSDKSRPTVAGRNSLLLPSLKPSNVEATQPLLFVTPYLFGEEVSRAGKEVFDQVRKATVPSDIDGYIALLSADAISGAFGAILSRTVADIVGDKKRDTTITKVLTTGSFFGSRGIARAGFQLLGLPRPVAILLSSLFASFVSEEAKFLSRKSAESALSNSSSSSPASFNETLSFREIYSDVSKWLVFDTLIETDPIFSLNDARYFVYGSVSAVIALFVKGDKTKDDNKESYSVKLVKTGLEGGVLFLSYEEFLNFLGKVVPKDLNMRFLFNSVIEDLEDI